MKYRGDQLIFVSQIKRDGSGVKKRIDKRYREMLKKEEFEVICLSMSEGTYIAHCFNAFVVKLKKLDGGDGLDN